MCDHAVENVSYFSNSFSQNKAEISEFILALILFTLWTLINCITFYEVIKKS